MKTLLHIAALLLSLPALASPEIAVLVSDDLPEYDAPIDAFTQSIDSPVQVLRIAGDRKRAHQLARNLRADPPPAIFALGAKAAYTAVQQVPGVPVIYAMVMDPQRYGITGAFVTGVSMEVPPDLVLAQFQLFAPKVERIGIVVGTDNERDSVGQAIEAARSTGYEVLVRRVSRSADARRAFNHLLRDVDAIWLLPDADIVTPANFQYVKNAATRARVPILAYSELLVQAGALMGVAADYRQAGTQAAELTRRVLDGQTAGAIDPVAPESPRVVLNRATQEAIGLRLDPVMLDFVDEVVRKPTER